MYREQHWAPWWSYLLLAVQVHTTHCRMYREQHWAPWWSYLLLTVQVHTTHCRRYREQHWAPWWSYHSWLYKYTQHTAGCIENSIGPCDGVIYSWLYKHTQYTAGCIENSIGPHDGVITLGCTSTHNTLQILQRIALRPVPPKADLLII